MFPRFARPRLSRRALLRAVGAGAVATAGGGLLAACSETTRGGGSAEAVGALSSLVPKYVPWSGVTLPESDLLPGKSLPNGLKAPDGLLRYPETLVRAVPEPAGEGSEYTSMTPLWSPAPDYPNDYYRAIAERTGTTIRFNPRDGNTYQDILTAVLGAQDHPHITMVPSWNIGIPRFSEAVENLFADLTPILGGKDIAERWPLLANLPTPAWQECVWGGKLKALPQISDTPFGNPMFCRKDILDELGVAYPTTADELYELGKEVTDAAGKRWAFGGIELFVNQMFRVPDMGWRLEADGTLVNAIETEERRAALEFLVKLFDEGLVHPNEGSEAFDGKQLFRSGELLLRYDGWGDWSEALAAMSEEDAGYNQQPVPVFAHDGGEPLVYSNASAWGFTFLHKDLTTEQIEEILDVANWLAAPFGTEEYEMVQFGAEGVHFERDADNRPELNDQGKVEAGAPSPTYYFVSGRPGAPIEGNWPGYVESRVEWGNHAVDFVPPERLFAGIRVEEPTALQQANQTLDDKVQDLIRGRIPMTQLDTIIEEWRTSGGDQGRDFYKRALEERDGGTSP